MFVYLALAVLTILISIKIYFVYSTKRCVNHVSLVEKTVIITGANRGIGFYAALEFAKRGAKVILCCRDKTKAEAAKKHIKELTQNPNIVVKLINFSSLDSVRECAADILKTEKKIDVLVNNAGAGGLADKISSDGLQVLMQINYFGPVLFTLLLLGLLKKTPGGRIINVASLMAKVGKCTPQNLNQYAGRYGTYANSKLCNILFSIKLAANLKDDGIPVFSLHPGAVKTDIFRRLIGWRKTLLDFVAYFTFKDAENGAQTIIYTATELGLEKFSGSHFEECAVVPPYSNIDVKLVEEVWEQTFKILHIDEKLYFK